MTQVRLKVADKIIHAEAIGESKGVSKHTGKELVAFEVRFRAEKTQHDAIQKLLGEGSGALLSEENVGKELPVRLEQTQYSYSDIQPLSTYIWKITEIENLGIESLQLGEVTATPYRYQEEISSEALVITTCFDLDRNTYEAFNQLPESFHVVRKGISDEPRLMRFGQTVWSSDDDDKFKISATIVETVYDQVNKSHGILEPMFSNVRNEVAATSVRLDRLLVMLVQKGVLSSEDREKIGVVTNEELRRMKRSFSRVSDFGAWIEAD